MIHDRVIVKRRHGMKETRDVSTPWMFWMKFAVFPRAAAFSWISGPRIVFLIDLWAEAPEAE